MEKIWFNSWPKNVRKQIEYPDITLHEHFENLVQKNPNLPFLSILGINFTYTQVNEQANRLAQALLRMGVKKGDKIGIFAPNLPQWAIAFFGILKTGAIVVPVSPLLGSEDLKHLIQDSELKIMFVLDLLYPTLPEVCAECPVLNNLIVTSLGDLLSPMKRL